MADDIVFEVPEFSNAERLDMSHRAWQRPDRTMSIRKIAKVYGVSQSTLQKQTKGTISKAEANQALQRLSPGEEDCLRDWCMQLARWGWPLRICQLRTMA